MDCCAVCLYPLSPDDARLLLCDHRLHAGCVRRHLSHGGGDCPLCRREIVLVERAPDGTERVETRDREGNAVAREL